MTIYGDYSWLIRIFDVCKYCVCIYMCVRWDNGIISMNHWILVVVWCLIMVNIICFILQWYWTNRGKVKLHPKRELFSAGLPPASWMSDRCPCPGISPRKIAMFFLVPLHGWKDQKKSIETQQDSIKHHQTSVPFPAQYNSNITHFPIVLLFLPLFKHPYCCQNQWFLQSKYQLSVLTSPQIP